MPRWLNTAFKHVRDRSRHRNDSSDANAGDADQSHNPSSSRTREAVKETEPVTSSAAAAKQQVQQTQLEDHQAVQPVTAPATPENTVSPAFSQKVWEEAYGQVDAKLTEFLDHVLKLELADDHGQSKAPTPGLSQNQAELRQERVQSLAKTRHENATQHKAPALASAGLKIVTQFKDTIGSSLEAYPPASLAFAGVMLLANCFGASLVAREKNLNGLEYIIKQHQWYLTLTNVLLKEYDGAPDQDTTALRLELRQRIIKFFTSLIQYQLKSVYCYYRHHRWTTLLKDQLQWNDWEGDVAEIKTAEDILHRDVANFNQHLGLEFQSKQTELLNKMLNFESGKEERKKAKLTKEAQKSIDDFIDRFRIPDFNSETSKDRLNPELAAGTGGWFKNHLSYRQWAETTGGMLVLAAHPGCGKSVLARSVVDDLQEKSKTSRDIFVCYFFFKDTSNVQNSATNALCAMVHQLLTAMPPELVGEIKSNMHTYISSQQRRPEDLGALWDIFMRAIDLWDTKRITCVLDAMDECGTETKSHIISNLSSYVHDSNRRARFLITTRPYGDILGPFVDVNPESVFILEVHDQELDVLSEEIDHVIEDRLHSLATRKWNAPSPTAIKKIREAMKTKRNRTYLWLRLVFEILEKSSTNVGNDWVKPIREIPETVDDAYEVLLERAEKPGDDKLRVIISMVLAAQRPLTLAELITAYLFHRKVHQKEFRSKRNKYEIDYEDDDDLEEDDSVSGIDDIWLNDVSGCVIQAYRGEVSLVHQTVKEFLLSPATDSRNIKTTQSSGYTGKWKFSISECSAHRILAEACIMFATQPQFFRVDMELPSTSDRNFDLYAEALDWADLQRGGSGGTEYLVHPTMERYVDSHFDNYPFLHYCYQYWSEHVRQSQRLNERGAILESIRSYTSYIQTKYSELVYRRNLMHYDSWVRNLNEFEADYWRCSEWKLGESRTVFAAQTGHIHLIEKVLEQELEHDADPQNVFSTLLEISVARNYVTATEFLLLHPMRPNLHSYSATLMNCNSARLALLLQEAGIDVNASISRGRTLMHNICSRHEQSHLVARLIENGANPNIADDEGVPPIHVCQSEKIASVLLEAGVDFRASDNMGDTALHHVASDGRTKIVKMLLDAGAVVDAVNSDGNTPLHQAAYHSQREVVELLLNAGASLHVKNTSGNTPLQHTCIGLGGSGGSDTFRDIENLRECLRLLIDSGGDPNDASSDGLPLYMLFMDDLSRRDMNLPSTEFLLQHGATLEAKDNEGRTLAYRLAQQATDEWDIEQLIDQLQLLFQRGLDGREAALALPKIANLPCYRLKSDELKRNIWSMIKEAHTDVNMLRSDQGDSLLHLFVHYDFDYRKQSFSYDQYEPAWVRLNTIQTYISELLEHGADPNLKNCQNETPFFSLCKQQGPMISRILQDYPEFLLAMAGQLLENGADTNIPALCGCTALDVLTFEGLQNHPTETGKDPILGPESRLGAENEEYSDTAPLIAPDLSLIESGSSVHNLEDASQSDRQHHDDSLKQPTDNKISELIETEAKSTSSRCEINEASTESRSSQSIANQPGYESDNASFEPTADDEVWQLLSSKFNEFKRHDLQHLSDWPFFQLRSHQVQKAVVLELISLITGHKVDEVGFKDLANECKLCEKCKKDIRSQYLLDDVLSKDAVENSLIDI